MNRRISIVLSFAVFAFSTFYYAVAAAQVPPMVLNRADWWRNTATLDMDFLNNRYMVSITTPATYTNLTQFISAVGGTFARNSIATYFDATGTMVAVPADTPRLDHDPATGEARGVLIEEARTNYVSNSVFVGAGTGTSATLPNGWGWQGLAVNYAISGTGYEDGIPFLDLRLWGNNTTGSSVGLNYCTYDVNTSGTVWTASHYIRLIGGTANNLDVQSGLLFDVSGSAVVGLNSANSLVPVTSPLKTQRFIISATAPADTTRIRPRLRLTPSGAFDITLRIGAPQMEKGEFPTSYIVTTGAVATREADAFTIPVGGWYASGEGTLFGEGVIPAGFGAGHKSLYAMDDGTPENSIGFIGSYKSSGFPAAEIITTGAPQYLNKFSGSGTTEGTPFRTMLAFKANDTTSAVSSTVSALDTAVVLPSVDRFRIGNARGGIQPLNGWVRRAGYFPTRQPDHSLADYTR